MFVATFGGGLNKLLSFDNSYARFRAYTMKEGLPSDVLLSLEEDKEGNLWCATEEELYKFNPSSEKIINYPSRFFPGKSISTKEPLYAHSQNTSCTTQ